jgi:acyl transferase domain-containing protein/phosphopantetheinyl transferase
MSCIFPGAPDLVTYWQNIITKVDAIVEPPEDWNAELFVDSRSSANDRSYCSRGGYLGSLARFDPMKHGVMPNSVSGGEPDQFLALEAAHTALVDAGYFERPVDGARVEVILGRGTYINRGLVTVLQHGVFVDRVLAILRELHPEHSESELSAIKKELKASIPPFNADTAPGLVPNLVTGRVANRMNFLGANYIIDAACASSLVAVDRGMQDLRSGRCDLAVVGGIQASTPAPILMIFCQLGALSRSGRIRPFDKDADGTLLGEGVGILVLKRRADAEVAGDRIYALLKGVGIASDGRSVGLLAPRVEGQELAIGRAYEEAGLSPRTVQMIEAHGTATSVGDRVELQALSRVFGMRGRSAPWCAVGSVKSMIGHLLPASGAAGLIKAALALYHKVLPPTLHCVEPNPEFALGATPFYINSETRPWVNGRTTPRRAGVSSFGFGGINAHAVLEEHCANPEIGRSSLQQLWPTEVCIFSAQSRADLLATCKRARSQLAKLASARLSDVAFGLNCPLPTSGCRVAIVAASIEDLESKVDEVIDRLGDAHCTQIRRTDGIYFFEHPLGENGALAFMFPGEGSQYPNMLRELCVHFPEIRALFDLIDGAFSLAGREYLPSELIFPPTGVSDSNRRDTEDVLRRTEFASESIFAASLGLLALLDRLEIKAHAIVGHSTGEFSGLIASGANPLNGETRLKKDILELNSLYRSLAEVGKIPEGNLVSVSGIDKQVILPLLERHGDLELAMDNCPQQIIVCGTTDSTTSLRRALRNSGAVCMPLPFSRAYHTRHFRAFCDAYAEFLQRFEIRAPRIALYSCSTAALFPNDPVHITRLAADQWGRTVRFRETIEAMYDAGIRIFLEVGPRNNLTAFVDNTLDGKPHLAVPLDMPSRSGLTQLNHCLALLAAHSVPMVLDHLYVRRACKRLSLDDPILPQQILVQPQLSTGLQPLRLVRNGKTARDLPQVSVVGAPAQRADKGDQVAYDHDIVDLLKPLEQLMAGKGAPGTGAENRPMEHRALSTEHSQKVHSRDRQVMEGFLSNMEKFLNLQEQVMESFLKKPSGPFSGGGRAPDEPAASFITNEQQHTSSNIDFSKVEPHPSANGSDKVDGPSIPAPTNHNSFGEAVHRFPLIGKIVRYIPGNELVALRVVDQNEDLFLADHTLGRHVATGDNTLSGLAIVPLTFSVEMLLEAAALLFPAKVPVAIKDVRAHRWIALDHGPISLEIRARSNNSHDRTEVKAEIAEHNPMQSSPLAEATVVLMEYPEQPHQTELALTNDHPITGLPDDFYGDSMFHGPRFQAVTSLSRWGDDGVEGRLTTLPSDQLFRSVQEPDFVLDPVLLDGAGQVLGYWAGRQLEVGSIIFPFKIDRLTIFRERLRPDHEVVCRVKISDVNGWNICCDIDLIGPLGDVLIRIEGWHARRFNLPTAFQQLRVSPVDGQLSSLWEEPVRDLPKGSICCCRLDAFDDGFLGTHGGIWDSVLAHLVLSSPERIKWRSFKSAKARRYAWLRGRCAAKDAVRLLLKRKLKVDLTPADIEIANDHSGRPVAHGPWAQHLETQPQISISHTDGVAAALASLAPNCLGIGFDIELARPLTEGFAKVACSPTESDFISSLPQALQEEWILRLWCAKEAVGKALGTGVVGRPKDIAANDFDQKSGRLRITLSSDLVGKLHGINGTSLSVWTTRIDKYIAAACLWTRN